MKQIESFFWGVIAACGALLLQISLFAFFSIYQDPTGELSLAKFLGIPSFLIVTALIEELLKYIIILKRIDLFSLEKSYIFNSFLVGLGFFVIELALIIESNSLPSLNLVIEIAILHIGTAGLMGYMVATRNPRRVSTFLLAVGLATVFHLSYNLLSLERNYTINYAIFFLLALLVLTNLFNISRISRKLSQR